MTDWDDLRFFLAVARAGSLSAAARTLGVNHATVSRRLRALERRVGAQLFERRPDGWTPTPAGREMLTASLRIEEEIQGIDRRVSGRDGKLAGPLRVAMSDVAVQTLLPQLRAFSESFPEVTLELVVSNRPSDLARREADVALRVTENPSESLVGRRLASVASSIYASLDYLARHPDAADLEAQAWLGFDGSLAEIPMARWMRDHVPRARIVARFDSSLLAYAAVRAGLGLGLLPCVIADADPELRRVAPEFLLRGTELWALTHADLRSTARVRAFLDFMRDAILGMRERIEGRSPQPASGVRRAGRALRGARRG